MKIDNFDDDYLTTLWENFDWKENEQILMEFQTELTKASLANNKQEIKKLQKAMVNCVEIRALAVREVAVHKGGSGVDGVRWNTSAEKMKAVFSLVPKDYKAMPYRQIILKGKLDEKERRVNVPTWRDRAMQKLYSYTLAPVIEATGEKKSFAFRKGRSIQDVHAYIFHILKGTEPPPIIIVADIKAFYSSIQHKWLLDHVPMNKKILTEFLKAGFVFAGELFPTEQGISLAGSLSPLLGNFMLDGLQTFIYKKFNGNKKEIDYANGNIIRFADDILITARTKEDADRIIDIVKNFLETRGLRLSEEKTKISHITEGFTFLSHTYIQKDGMLYSFPSEIAVTRFIEELREIIMTHKQSQRKLIEIVNKKLRGWAMYHRYTNAKEAFEKVDQAVQIILMEAAMKLHPKRTKQSILKKYWYLAEDGTYVYALPNQREIRIIKIADTVLISHKGVNIRKNPYLNVDYFEKRKDIKDIGNVTGKYRTIWQKQNGKCFYCGREILKDHKKEVVPIDLTKKETLLNLAYIHKLCSDNQFLTQYISDDVSTLKYFDILEILEEIENHNRVGNVKKRKKGIINSSWTHYHLKKYFEKQTAAHIKLKFSEIEEIEGVSLAKTARNSRSYWCPRKNFNTIAEAWLTEGYVLAHLDLEKETVLLKRVENDSSKVEIPDSITKGKIPQNAKFEIEHFLEHITKKYGL